MLVDLTIFGLQALKTDEKAVAQSLMGRVSISEAMIQVLLQGPLKQSSGSQLHSQALNILNKLHTLGNFLDD